MSAISYGETKLACYLGYITQAISINLLPLLYVVFQREFHITLTQLGLLATVVFVIQIIVDLLAAWFSDYLSYRAGCVAAHVFATVGLVLISFLPSMMSNSYVGILIPAILLSIGGGLTEVLISPVVDAIPGESKVGQMSLLHSFYCWGVVGVALLSTVYFAAFGTSAWRWLLLLWAVVPAATTLLFALVPLPPRPEDAIKSETLPRFWKKGLFWLLMALMLFSGASELCLSQWASFFAEKGLRVSKALGDLLGPCAFALFQGISRVLYAKLTTRYDARRLLVWCAIGCTFSYGMIVFSPWPIISLSGFCLGGLFVGPMWPGILSLSSARFPVGGTAMFAMLALCGDLGCASAPALVGYVSDGLQYGGVGVADAMRIGFGVCALSPFMLAVGLFVLRKKKA